MTSRLLPGVVCAVVAAGWLSGCTHDVVEVGSPVDMPATFSQTGQTAMPAQWWKSFEDEQLNALMEQAVGHNLTLAMAWDRLAAAKAAARKAGADLLPQVDGAAGATTQKSRQLTGGTYRTDASNAFSLGLSASYEVDLWGRIRSTRDAAALDAQAAGADVDAAAMTLSASVASVWYQWVEQQGQLRLLDQQVKTNQQVLGLVNLRFEQGQATAADVLRQRQLVESTRSVRIDAATQAAVLEHELAILLGKQPRTVVVTSAEDAPVTLPQLPQMPETGLPVELLRRRPDLRTAYLNVAAADHRLAAAIADQYPKLSLTAGASTSVGAVRDLFDNWLATLAANLTEPIFDGHRKAEEVRRQRALVSQTLHSYGQTTLTALGEVEDALVRETQQGAKIDNLDAQLKLSSQVLERLHDRYVNGSVEYLDILNALVTHQSLQRTRLTAMRQRIDYRIALCRALGGGWQMDRPELATPAAMRGERN